MPVEQRAAANADWDRHLNSRRGARNSYLHFYYLMRSPTEFSCAISHILEQEVETTYKIIIPDETSSYFNRPPKELVLSESGRTLINNEHSCIFSSCFGMGWLTLIIHYLFCF